MLITLALSTFSSVSLFCVLTYVAPMLEQVTGISPHGILLVFGVGITIGNLVGGWLSDWRQVPSIVGLMVLLMSVLGALFFAERYALLCVIALLVWGRLLRPAHRCRRGWLRRRMARTWRRH